LAAAAGEAGRFLRWQQAAAAAAAQEAPEARRLPLRRALADCQPQEPTALAVKA
jgi:hypothetical protein